MKRIITFAAALCCLFCFAACGMNSTVTKNFSTIAEEFTEKMYQEDYDGVASYIDEEYAETLNAEALAEIVAGTEKAYGDFQEITGIEQTDMTSYISAMELENYYSPDDMDFLVYYESVAFERGEMGIYFLFDRDDRTVCGITVCGTEALSEEGSSAESQGDVEK